MTAARTHAQRVKALDALLPALGIGVYRPDGTQVAGGFERSARGIYLYSFEVSLIADQLGRKQMGSFDQLAAQFTKAGIKLKRRSLTGARLAAAAASGIRRLDTRRGRRTPGGALAAVVRQLGRARRVDLIHPPAADALVLDPVQRMLLAIDVSRSATGQDRAPGPGATHPHATRARAAEALGCPSGPNSFGGGSSYGKPLTMLAAGAAVGAAYGKTNGNPKGAGLLLKLELDGIDGVAIAYSVGFQPVQRLVSGVFGTDGPGSAKPMQFQVKVSMLDNYPKSLTCGRLAGYQFPKPGGVQGVRVVFTPHATSAWQLSDLSTGNCVNGCATVTDADGLAAMTVQPYDEYLPLVGTSLTQGGIVEAEAYPQLAAHNILGIVSEVLGGSKFLAIPWIIQYQDPGGYRVQVPTITGVWKDPDPSDDETVTGTYTLANEEVCTREEMQGASQNPLAPGQPQLGANGSTVTINGTATGDGQTESFTVSGGPVPIPIDFTAVSPTNFGNGDDGAFAIGGLWQFGPSPVLHAEITATPQPFSSDHWPPLSPTQTFDVPVTQAEQCGNAP